MNLFSRIIASCSSQKMRGVLVFSCIFLGVCGVVFVNHASAQSISEETAERAAQIALDGLIVGARNRSGSESIQALASEVKASCNNVTKEARGENASGTFIAIFRGTSENLLSCNDSISSVAFVQVTGKFAGRNRVIGSKILDEDALASKCGSANGGRFSEPGPSSIERCERGTSTPLARSDTQWIWICIGDDGENVSCSARLDQSETNEGLCGNAAKNYTLSDTTFSGSLCSRGTAQPGNPAFPQIGSSVSWKCVVSGGTDSDSCVARRLNAGSNDCSRITNSTALLTGYGPPFNRLSVNQEPILTVSCPSDTITATAGNATIQTYVYNKGFVYSNNAWQAVSFSGTEASGNPGWYTRTATVSGLPEVSSGVDAFIIAFVCQYQGTEWKCGCRDSACSQNYWTIQSYGR